MEESCESGVQELCRRHIFAVVALVLVGLPQPALAVAADSACPPAAVVVGPADIADAVAALLRSHGVGSDPGTCRGGRVVRATFTAADARSYWLHIDDGFGRTSDRKVSDVNTAASLIETWAVGEDMDVLSPRSVVATPEATPETTKAGGVVAADTGKSTARLMGFIETSIAPGTNVSYGGSVTGCTGVGSVCIGGRARLSRGGDTIDSAVVVGVPLTRTGADLLAVVALPVSGHRFFFAPVVGVGAGWTNSSATVRAPYMLTRDDFGLRFEAGLLGGWRVGARWAILAEVGGTVGRRTSGDPDLITAAVLAPPPETVLRTAVGCQFTPGQR